VATRKVTLHSFFSLGEQKWGSETPLVNYYALVKTEARNEPPSISSEHINELFDMLTWARNGVGVEAKSFCTKCRRKGEEGESLGIQRP
jgi:hypothetical protein